MKKAVYILFQLIDIETNGDIEYSSNDYFARICDYAPIRKIKDIPENYKVILGSWIDFDIVTLEHNNELYCYSEPKRFTVYEKFIGIFKSRELAENSRKEENNYSIVEYHIDF